MQIVDVVSIPLFFCKLFLHFLKILGQHRGMIIIPFAKDSGRHRRHIVTQKRHSFCKNLVSQFFLDRQKIIRYVPCLQVSFNGFPFGIEIVQLICIFTPLKANEITMQKIKP